MKWVTRDRVHLDRVACPWLIQRFVDKSAEFVFVPWGKEDQRPADAVPYALPGVELGPHDDAGSTFDKIMRKYEVKDPALNILADIINSGIHQALHHGHKDEFEVPRVEGIGLGALSEGIMLITRDDHDNLEKSFVMYDALYAYCRSLVMIQEDPSLKSMGILDRSTEIKKRLRA